MFLSRVHWKLICYHPQSVTQNDKATTTKNLLGTVIHSTGRALASVMSEIICVMEQCQLLDPELLGLSITKKRKRLL